MPKQRQSRYIHVLIILVGLMGGYMYNTTFGFDAASSDDNITALIFSSELGTDSATRGGLEQFADKSFNLSVLQNSVYQSLETIGETDIQGGITGRANIFAPF